MNESTEIDLLARGRNKRATPVLPMLVHTTGVGADLGFGQGSRRGRVNPNLKLTRQKNFT